MRPDTEIEEQRDHQSNTKESHCIKRRENIGTGRESNTRPTNTRNKGRPELLKITNRKYLNHTREGHQLSRTEARQHRRRRNSAHTRELKG